MVVGNAAVTLAGTVMAGLGVYLLARRETQLAVGALGAFLLVRGLLNLINGSTGLLSELTVGVRGKAGIWVEISAHGGVACAAMTPFLVLLFVSVYPRRRGPFGTNRTARRGLYAVTVLAGLVLALEPGAVYTKEAIGVGPEWLVDAAPLSLLVYLLVPAYALAGLVFVRDYLHEAPVPDRDGLLFVVVGLMFDGTNLSLLASARLLDSSPPANPTNYVHAWGVIPLVAALGLLVHHAVTSREPSERRKMGWTIAGLLAPVLLFAAVTYPAGIRASGRTVGGLVIDAISVLALPLLIAYGVLRHNLLDLGLDVNLSRGVRSAAALGGLLVVYAFVSIAAEAQLGEISGHIVAVLATALLVVSTVLLSRRFSLRGQTGFGLGSGGAYLDREALDVYRETLQEALVASDRSLTDRDERVLGRMRERLGISDREHEMLRHGLTAGADAGSDELLVPGHTIAGRYRVEEELATGGHGATYVAHDEQLDRPVVLKGLRSTNGDVELDEEARRLGATSHPTVVTVHDLVEIGDEAVVVMEHVSRGSLADRLEEGPLDLDAFAKIATDALTALEVVHEEGMIHRDVKPGNLLLTEDGGAKLADFGVARATAEETTMGVAASEPVGTLRYMSPEQAKGRPVDERSDLYSLAATLYEAYTDEPYVSVDAGESLVEVQLRVAGLGPFDEEIDAPEALHAWFATALAPRPEDRFASAREMRHALADALARDDEPEA
jgi:hypothetical protein